MNRKFLHLNFFLSLLCSLILHQAVAQCPPNIDFEEGTFNGWKCYNAIFSGYSTMNPGSPIAPIAGQHDIMSRVPGDGLDPYGNFPKNCPNGSGYSIRIGNTTTGHTLDKVSYTFTIPATQNSFSLIYYYAIVLNDAGNSSHPPDLQPRLIIDVKNITDGTPLTCPLPPIVASSSLPGFFQSSVPGAGGTAVYCKDWAAASINLDGNAGKTFEISFTATGCGLSNGSHFGYAYVDVNSECSSSFVGATYCHDDAFINVTAPYGYSSYAWYDDAGLTHQIGATQTINFTPPPPPGTLIYVKMEPYAGYGCSTVLAAELLDTLTIQPNPGADQVSCNGAPVQLGGNPKATYVYSWSPTTGLSDPNIANPTANPAATTKYTLTVSHEGGGCVSTADVKVTVVNFDKDLKVTGNTTFCAGTGETTLLETNVADIIQWYNGSTAIPGATSSTYTVTQSGSYYAELKSNLGCSLTTNPVVITVNPKPTPAIVSNNPVTQCLYNNSFGFTNNTTIAAGGLQYSWNFGDGSPLETTANVTHVYTAPGSYLVKMIATGDAGCVDSASLNITVNPSPDTTLTTTGNTSICNTLEAYATLQVPATTSIQWYQDNVLMPGATQPQLTITQSGTYYAMLSNSFSCGATTGKRIFAVNPTPLASFGVNQAVQCSNNSNYIFTNNSTLASGTLTYNWALGDGTTQTTTDATKIYTYPGTYIVKLTATSDFGCIDDSSFTVTVLPAPKPDFTIQPSCINLPVLVFNKTINNLNTYFTYLWDFGDGYTTPERDPVYTYTQPGTYDVKLYASTPLCAPIVSQHTVVITAPEPAVRYADVEAITNYRLTLNARPIGRDYTWSPAFQLDNPRIYNPVFQGVSAQLYTVKIKTAAGCETVDTQYVKTRKRIEVNMPKAFTPGNDNINDYLYPGLMGYAKMNYFKIYDRWGKLLFETKADRPGWDGRVNGQFADPQTVVWVIEAVDIDGKVHHEQGTTILLR